MIYSYYIVVPHKVHDDGQFPNSDLPVLHYKKAFDSPWFFPLFRVKRLLARNGWRNARVNDVHNEEHYHSNTHELLGIIRGKIRMQVGGGAGVEIVLCKGDILLIPAGVPHKKLQTTEYFSCIGAYPDGVDFDLNYGKCEEHSSEAEKIKSVSIPERDPVTGESGKLHQFWVNQL